MTYGTELSKIQNTLFIIGLVIAMGLLFIVLTQPAWNGDKMVANMRTNCNKVGGVMLETKQTFGTTYECSPRFDKGINE